MSQDEDTSFFDRERDKLSGEITAVRAITPPDQPYLESSLSRGSRNYFLQVTFSTASSKRFWVWPENTKLLLHFGVAFMTLCVAKGQGTRRRKQDLVFLGQAVMFYPQSNNRATWIEGSNNDILYLWQGIQSTDGQSQQGDMYGFCVNMKHNGDRIIWWKRSTQKFHTSAQLATCTTKLISICVSQPERK